METDFSAWLFTELKLRDWTQADLANKSGLSQGAISKVVNKQRKPGFDFCEGLSRALKLPVETIFEAAGLLPPIAKSTAQKEQLNYLYDHLKEVGQEDLISYAHFLLEKQERSS